MEKQSYLNVYTGKKSVGMLYTGENRHEVERFIEEKEYVPSGSTGSSSIWYNTQYGGNENSVALGQMLVWEDEKFTAMSTYDFFECRRLDRMSVQEPASFPPPDVFENMAEILRPEIGKYNPTEPKKT